MPIRRRERRLIMKRIRKMDFMETIWRERINVNLLFVVRLYKGIPSKLFIYRKG